MRRKIVSRDRSWYRWFAWYPVRIDDEWVWLEHIERQITDCMGYLVSHYRWNNQKCICTDAELQQFGSPDPLCPAWSHGSKGEKGTPA